VALDGSGRANGRGAYVCRDSSCIDTALERGLLARALDHPVPAGLASELSGALSTTTIQGGTRGQE
jgi:predicted RNA-binding protein YlxR (DUF448 family)